MLLADSADLADVVDKADVSFRCSVALTDTDVSKSLQEVSPGVGPYPVPHGQAYFMIAVSVTLHEGKKREGTKAPSTKWRSSSISFPKRQKQKEKHIEVFHSPLTAADGLEIKVETVAKPAKVIKAQSGTFTFGVLQR